MKLASLRTLLFAAAVTSVLTSATSSQGQSAPTLKVDVSTNVHSISPNIYGLAYGPGIAGPTLSYASSIKLTNVRWGGDGSTRYNWNFDSTCNGADFWFICGQGTTLPTPGHSPDYMISAYRSAYAGTQPLISIPIIPYINGSYLYQCSFRVSVYGPQQQTYNGTGSPAGDSCGNGKTTSGTNITDTNISYNMIPNSVAIQKAWVEHLVSTFGTAANGGVPFYQLDNEPGGWSNIHRDAIPTNPDYGTITSLGQSYAAMIKGVDSGASVLGPSDYGEGGWVLLNPSGSTTQFSGQYYLQQMAAYEAKNGERVLDYFDEHWYCHDTSTDAKELASPRALWDPTYLTGSWVEQSSFFNGPMALIPRFKNWVSTYYPGTKVSFSEYECQNNTNPIVDMLANTDILGIYGYQGLDFADNFNNMAPGTPVSFSYLMYRNYDGAGSQFGDTSVASTSTDPTQATLSVYGALRSTDKALTIMVINKTTSAIQTSLIVANFDSTGSAAVYSYSGANLKQIVAGTAASVTSNTIQYSFPAYSATLFVLSPEAQSVPAAPTGLAAKVN